MKRISQGWMGCVCLAASLAAATAIGADGLGGVTGGLGGGVGGGATGPGVGGAAGAGGAANAAANAARLRVPGRGPAGSERPVGANFGPGRAGIHGGAGASAGAAGVGVAGNAGLQARAGVRGRQAGDAARPSDQAAAGQPRGPRQFDGHPQQTRLLLQADLILARRLADIDRLRDVALANGNEQLLERADQLETQARLQHDHRVAQVSAFQVERQPGETPMISAQTEITAESSTELSVALREEPQAEPAAETETESAESNGSERRRRRNDEAPRRR